MNDQTEYLHFGIPCHISLPWSFLSQKTPHTLYPIPFYTLGAAASTSGFT
jgi:hypothetical protein